MRHASDRLGSLLTVALYRKYRPATFAEVVGQEHVTEPLSTALTAGRINHAYLFSGPRGCGKTSSARILARSLNCEQGPTPTPCGVCDSCVALAPNGPGSVDVIELDAASHGGVDDTRELRDRAFYAPAQSRYRIFIIDEAHMVTTAGFNALLKIVEEPPEHLIFVFATTEPEKVLPTIRSRTHHYPFRLLAPRTMRALLERICAQEDVDVDDAVYPLVIRAGGGSPRDTLSVLDQLLAGADGNRVAYPRALALLGATDVALIDDAVDALAAGDAAALFGAVEAVIDAGHDPRRFATDLLERFRDLIVLQAVPDAAARGVVDAPEDVLERMRDQADADRHRDADPLRRGGARRAGRDARRHRAAAAARGGVRAAAAAVGQRHRIGAAATGRAHRDAAGHVDSREQQRRSPVPPQAVRPQDQAARSSCRHRANGRARTGAEPRQPPAPVPSLRPRRNPSRPPSPNRPRRRAPSRGPAVATAGAAAVPTRSWRHPPHRRRRRRRTRTRPRCAACGRRCGRRCASAAAPPR